MLGSFQGSFTGSERVPRKMQRVKALSKHYRACQFFNQGLAEYYCKGLRGRR